jgi:hypothetical protein
MADEIDRKLLDKRVAHRYVRKGLLDEKDWEKHLKSLPDVAAQAVPVESDLDQDDLDEDEPEPSSGASASEGPKEG